MKEIYIKDTENLIGKEIDLYGWVETRRDHGKIIFIDLKDSTGTIQTVAGPWLGETYSLVEKLRPEWVVKFSGIVKERPDNMKNDKILLGNIEFEIKNIEILGESNTHPFDVYGDGKDIGEETRMIKRYLDLKRPRMRDNLKKRALLFKFIRDYLYKQEFLEIDTPYLTKSTPEGARDFLVPSRLGKGLFYALPQSPQQYKQMLMVSQVEKYFQLVRCFRDEDPRGDRQPEFTQLDIEVSFKTEEQILNLTEEMVKEVVENLYPEKYFTQYPFPRIDYTEAMEKYGSDKPDIRKNKSDPNELGFAFIVNFPMFEWHEKQYNEEAKYGAVHHPFTKIRFEEGLTIDDKVKMINEKTGELRAYQYDLALNGYEIAGGSLRETDARILEAVFEKLGNNVDDFRNQFSHYIEMFGYGVPPHGGIAFGFDRLLMVLQNEESIREVIPFPKTGDNRDLMISAPSNVSEKQLKELNIKISN
jgi:aspartyl-tRNA synthetase